MGSASSKTSGEVGKLAGHYNELVDSMMKNQLVFDTSARNIARTEQEWFRRFEQQLEAPPVSEDALYGNISRFMKQSQQDVGGIVDAITDPAVRESARQVLNRTRTSVAMQKYYEYKYLHLSAVFLHFTEFVEKLMDIMSQGIMEATHASATSTADDIKRLLDAVGEMNISKTEAEVLKKSVRNVHGKAVQRLDALSEQMRAIAEVSGQQVKGFPAEQMAMQKEEEGRQFRRDELGRFAVDATQPQPQPQPQPPAVASAPPPPPSVSPPPPPPPSVSPPSPPPPPPSVSPPPPSGLNRTFVADGGSPLVSKSISALARSVSRIASGSSWRR